MNNQQLPIRGHSGQTRRPLFIVQCSLLIVLCTGSAGCGSDITDQGAPQATSLDGERVEHPPVPSSPAVDLTKAPTETHRRLGALLPGSALIKDSLRFAGWDGTEADFSAEEAASLIMPVTYGEYLSTGYELIGAGKDGEVLKQRYPQSCRLFVIQAPDALAAQAIARNIVGRLEARGFARREPMEVAMGARTPPSPDAVRIPDADKLALRIERFVGIEHGDDADRVYVGYIYVDGELVVYALEMETAARITGPDEMQFARVVDDQRGTRLGAQLIVLVHHRRG